MGEARVGSSLLFDLYESLTTRERKFLGREFVLARNAPEVLAFLRTVPYPLPPDTASAVRRVSRPLGIGNVLFGLPVDRVGLS